MTRFPFAIRCSLLALLLGAIPTISEPARAASDSTVQMGKIAAHPALWIVRGKTATAYLFGSIHLLPANVDWHTPKIDAALDKADIFVFEAPLDEAGKAAAQEFVRENGTLPDGTTLSSLLSKQGLSDYQRAIALAQVAPSVVEHERPWLAEIVLDVAYLQKLRYVVADGVDQQIYALALQRKKEVRYFETPAQQLALFMPKDKSLQIKEFEADLKRFQSEQSTIGAMVDAWGEGDVKTVGRLVTQGMDSVPGERKLVIDDRNAAWVKAMDAMLATRDTYFITVGTGHLVGPHGVPALLRARGLAVEGP